MAQVNKNNLGFLGEAFQYKLTHEFMENHTFFEDLSSILDQNMFTDPNLKTFVGVMKNYFEREGHTPSYEMMEIELRDISHSDKEIETYLAIIEKVKNTPSDGVDRIKDMAEKFFRQQNIVRTANEILRIAGNGDVEKYDTCVGLLNDAMTQGIHNDFGEKPLFLAPMEDVTDPAFRKLCKRFGADMMYTEFISADALIRNVPNSENKLKISD